MFSALTAMLVNVAANYVLIFGHLGFPPWESAGRPTAPFGSLCGLLVLLAAYLAPTNRREGVALPRYDGEVMRKLLRFGYPAGVELFLNLLAFTSMILLPFPRPRHGDGRHHRLQLGHGLLRAAARHPDRCRQPGRALHGCGPAEIAERVTRSGLKMGWSYSSVILVLFVGFPEQLVAVFQPGGQDPIFSEAASPRRRHAATGRLYVLADAMMVVQIRRPARRRGYLLDHVHLGRIALASAASALHHSEDSAAVAPDRPLALVILFLSFSGVFYLRYRSGHWKTLTVVGERQTVSRE